MLELIITLERPELPPPPSSSDDPNIALVRDANATRDAEATDRDVIPPALAVMLSLSKHAVALGTAPSY